jgi:hypothetical protein
VTPPSAAAARKAATQETSPRRKRPRATAAKAAPTTSARRSAGAARVRPQRRVSGPARKSSPAKPRGARAAARPAPRSHGPALAAAGAIGVRALPVLGTIASHAVRAGRTVHGSSMVDRLLRGRSWVGLLGVLLIGLVALNVSLLKMNAHAGRKAEVASQLRFKNAELRGRVARLGTADRIQEEGRRLGLIMPEANKLHYVAARPGVDAREALDRLDDAPYWATDDLVSAPGAITPTDFPEPSVQPPAAQGTPQVTAAPAPTSAAPVAPTAVPAGGGE